MIQKKKTEDMVLPIVRYLSIYGKLLDRSLILNKGNSVGEGAGLVLTRKVGERILIGANPKATDEEILAAIKGGMTISLVEVSLPRRPAGQRMEVNGNRREPSHAREFHGGKGSARIGLKAERAISISREEIVQDDKKA